MLAVPAPVTRFVGTGCPLAKNGAPAGVEEPPELTRITTTTAAAISPSTPRPGSRYRLRERAAGRRSGGPALAAADGPAGGGGAPGGVVIGGLAGGLVPEAVGGGLVASLGTKVAPAAAAATPSGTDGDPLICVSDDP